MLTSEDVAVGALGDVSEAAARLGRGPDAAAAAPAAATAAAGRGDDDDDEDDDGDEDGDESAQVFISPSVYLVNRI